MKLLTLALLFSLPVSMSPKKALPQPISQLAKRSHGGRWYFAASGHAVYCYGPVMTVSDTGGGLERVATFCKGDRLLVPLKD